MFAHVLDESHGLSRSWVLGLSEGVGFTFFYFSLRFFRLQGSRASRGPEVPWGKIPSGGTGMAYNTRMLPDAQSQNLCQGTPNQND